MIAKQLEAVRARRAELVAAMEKIVNDAEAADRPLTDDEQKQFDELRSQIGDCDARIKTLEETEQLVASSRAKRAEPSDDKDVLDEKAKWLDSPGHGPAIQKDTKRPKVKGAFFARQAHFLYLAQGNATIAAKLAEDAGDKEMAAVMRASVAGATTTGSGWADQLVQQEVRDFIEMLRPLSVLSRFPAGTTLDFDGFGSIKIPRMTSGTPGGFIAEGGAIPVKAGAFDSITLTPSKLGVITVATREVLARSTPALETLLRDSMLRDTAIVLDRRFLSSQAAGSGAPAGLFHSTNADAALTASNTSNAADDAIADLKGLLQAMFTANVPMNNLVWLMHSSKKLELMNLRSATGAFYFRDELIGGTLYGYPVLDSSVFDFGVNNGGASNIRTVALVDASMLVRANGVAPTIMLSQEATLHMDDAPNADLAVPTSGVRSLYQTDSTALRLTWETTWRTRHTAAVQRVDNINW